MTEQNYRQALKEAINERLKLLAEKNDREIRISQLNQTIYLLRKLCGDPVDADEKETGSNGTGLTGIVRNVLRSTPQPLSSLEIKNRLVEMNFPIKGNNPQAAVHTILRRLARQGEIVSVKAQKGNGKSTTQWRWKQIVK